MLLISCALYLSIKLKMFQIWFIKGSHSRMVLRLLFSTLNKFKTSYSGVLNRKFDVLQDELKIAYFILTNKLRDKLSSYSMLATVASLSVGIDCYVLKFKCVLRTIETALSMHVLFFACD
jgi:hypothetical protein